MVVAKLCYDDRPIKKTSEALRRPCHCAQSSQRIQSLRTGVYYCLHMLCDSASEMTYIVSGGALNSTHSLTLRLTDVQQYSKITYFIFAVFDVRRSVAVNMCINCSFLH